MSYIDEKCIQNIIKIFDKIITNQLNEVDRDMVVGLAWLWIHKFNKHTSLSKNIPQTTKPSTP